MVNFKEIYHFFKVPEGVQHFPGGGGVQLFPGGVQLHFPYRNPYNLYFFRGGGSGPPVPPSGSALAVSELDLLQTFLDPRMSR